MSEDRLGKRILMEKSEWKIWRGWSKKRKRKKIGKEEWNHLKKYIITEYSADISQTCVFDAEDLIINSTVVLSRWISGQENFNNKNKNVHSGWFTKSAVPSNRFIMTNGRRLTSELT